MQQIIRLKSLLLPGMNIKRLWVTWMFISGKFLRVIMPYILITLLILSVILAFDFPFFLFLLTGQISVYCWAVLSSLVNKGDSAESSKETENNPIQKIANKFFNNKITRLVTYLCQGHLMGFIGSASYLQSMFKKHVLGINSDQRWHKVEIKDK